MHNVNKLRLLCTGHQVFLKNHRSREVCILLGISRNKSRLNKLKKSTKSVKVKERFRVTEKENRRL